MNQVVTQQNSSILEIALNRPEKKNALTLQMYTKLTQVLQDAALDDNIQVVLLRGEGNAFCAGNDIADFVNAVDNPDTFNIILGFLHTLADFNKPVVAAVQGDAVGIGVTMLLHCDVVIAADNLRCKMPFVQLGLIAEAGSTLLLPGMIGQRQAFELLVEGIPFFAERAQAVGLVNTICAEADLLAAARQRTERVAQLPQNATRNTKRLMKQEYLEQLHRVIDDEGGQFYESMFSDEARQALQAFLSLKG